MGCKRVMVENLKVYKIDAEKNLIYVAGSIPGRVGGFLKIRDAYKKKRHNFPLLNFPTFVPNPKIQYAREIEDIASFEDPEEIYLHENVVID